MINTDELRFVIEAVARAPVAVASARPAVELLDKLQHELAARERATALETAKTIVAQNAEPPPATTTSKRNRG